MKVQDHLILSGFTRLLSNLSTYAWAILNFNWPYLVFTDTYNPIRLKGFSVFVYFFVCHLKTDLHIVLKKI